MYVCLCNGVTENDVHMSIAAGAGSTRDIRAACGMKPGCGVCTKRLFALLSEHRATNDPLKVTTGAAPAATPAVPRPSEPFSAEPFPSEPFPSEPFSAEPFPSEPFQPESFPSGPGRVPALPGAPGLPVALGLPRIPGARQETAA
ncbi:Bacterioferritin-associated ferredoxin [Thermomonospora echinospora]|uniref:Bacterioferritin-associated ferredoxin n=2 Tax=Thermomonospora echinospora TaxID=1992 RepID=A0A1H6DZN3_9ACTN|nr:Bacterioferritin-associated ferredoxin [Thermomonospora echinospora]